MSFRFAYLHGFGSGPRSYKGMELSHRFQQIGQTLETPDLNLPSFSTLSYQAILEGLALEYGDGALCPIGSSMGGYMAARFAQLNPNAVDRMVLLCPGFDLANRWPSLMGDAFPDWEATGTARFEDQAGDMVPLHWSFIEEARQHPSFPEFEQPTVIIHGIHDDIVPIETSRQVAERDNVTLIEVDDDHALANSLDIIWQVVCEHFELD